MTWTAQSFIDRVLNPRTHPPWWAERWDERSLEDALASELAQDIGDFRGPARKLLFFSTWGSSSTDGRAGPVGVELKYTNLSFEAVLDGAIHRGVLWVLGNPHHVDAPEAVSLHVVKPGSLPMAWDIASSLVPVLNSLAALDIHVAFVHAETGQSWQAGLDDQQVAPPPWLATGSGSGALSAGNREAVAQLDSADFSSGQKCQLFGRRRTYRVCDGPGGVKLARIEWPNEWQMIEVGLLLRGFGNDAVNVIYRGSRALVKAGQGVERKIQSAMRERFGVVLDWGVPV